MSLQPLHTLNINWPRSEVSLSPTSYYFIHLNLVRSLYGPHFLLVEDIKLHHYHFRMRQLAEKISDKKIIFIKPPCYTTPLFAVYEYGGRYIENVDGFV